MKKMRVGLWVAMMLALLCLFGCSRTETKSPDVADSIRKSLDQAGLHNISVAQDRDKGVVTLTGKVAVDGDKAKADSIANSMAGGQVVSDEIAVLPPGAESDARTVNSDLDKAIEKNVDAALIQNSLQKGVRYEVKNGVVTLKGNVDSGSKRARVEKVTSTVPNVRQVVNELDVRDQKASSTR